MSDEPSAKGWWSTLPGLITAVTATVTALTGLMVAINQTGWFGPRTPPAVTRPAPPVLAPPSGSVSPAQPTEAPPLGSSASPPPGRTYSVGLPALRDYRLGEGTFTLLKAEVAPRTSEKDDLLVRLRMLNRGRYDANFWDSSFRLLVDGVPMAPVGGLNELVPGQSAKEGEVLFVVPRGTRGATLKITYGGDSTEIPFHLESPH